MIHYTLTRNNEKKNSTENFCELLKDIYFVFKLNQYETVKINVFNKERKP